ncbi:hypothetical protein DFH08DRAFT_821379 [Mycena albidolilacea]|uniref:Uncharacterized protein n=1 Tax=Mycena albidolilacea TaxID=1033008 RepID=A0AAD6ZAS2_9AGAR|nr:hypothetical protein DFH08DRAFT_821379 [Mycena albidolilacea]
MPHASTQTLEVDLELLSNSTQNSQTTAVVGKHTARFGDLAQTKKLTAVYCAGAEFKRPIDRQQTAIAPALTATNGLDRNTRLSINLAIGFVPDHHVVELLSDILVNPSPELILKILEMFTLLLSFPTDHLPDRAALLSCSLVCQHRSTQPQRPLFRRATTNDPWAPNIYLMPGKRWARTINRIASFLETITADTDKARWLRESVLSIVLRPHSSVTPTDTLAILNNFPNLRELDILGLACLFSDAQLSQLRDEDHVGPITSIGVPACPAVLKLIKAIPTLRMLDVTSNTFQTFPAMPELEGPLGLRLMSFKFCSKWAGPLIAFLIRGHANDDVDDEPLQLYAYMESQAPADP